MQGKPRENPCIALDSLGGIRPFQRVTSKKIKKFPLLPTRALGCASRACPRVRSSPQAAAPDESIVNSLAWNPVFANKAELISNHQDQELGSYSVSCWSASCGFAAERLPSWPGHDPPVAAAGSSPIPRSPRPTPNAIRAKNPAPGAAMGCVLTANETAIHPARKGRI